MSNTEEDITEKKVNKTHPIMAYREGYISAITREHIKGKPSPCPFGEKTLASENWLRGHQRGAEVVLKLTHDLKQRKAPTHVD